MAQRPSHENDFSATGTRPPSVWPESQRSADFVTTAQVLTRFDPLAEGPASRPGATAFDVCHPALALRALLLVQLVLAIAVLATAQGSADWLARQGAAAFAGAAGAVLWLVLLCALRGWLLAHGTSWRVLVVLALGASSALLSWWPLAWVGLAADAGGLRPLGVALAGAGFAALLWGWLELRSRIWLPATSQARLVELQSRIRPHFLFNALNTAIALVRVDPARAESVLEDLAELFRVALAEVGTSVTLAEEVELARRYLAIEEMRFGERLQVRWHIDPRAEGARVPQIGRAHV